MIQNSFVFTETRFLDEKFKAATKNEYVVVSQRPYISKKEDEDNGVALTLQIIHDDTDYGVDKNTQLPRDDNRLNTFDVTILNNKTSLPVQKGDRVSLGEFIADKSYVIGFDLILRYKSIHKIQNKDGN